MKLAIIQTGGKQYLVTEGQTLTIEKIKPSGMQFDFNNVLLVQDGDEVQIGTPLVAGKKVTAQVLEAGKGKKISIVKFKRKVRYHKKQGHRQPFTKVKISNII